MLSTSVEIVGIDPTHRNRWAEVFDPPEGQALKRVSGLRGTAGSLMAKFAEQTGPGPAKTAVPGGNPILVLVQSGTVKRVLRWQDPGFDSDEVRAQLAQGGLAGLAQAHQASFVVRLETSVVPQLVATIARAQAATPDPGAQGIAVTAAIQPFWNKQIEVYPDPLARYRAVSANTLQTALDRAMPDGRSFAFYLFDGDAVWTSLIARKRQGHIDLVTTHQFVASNVSQPRISNVNAINAEIARRVAPVHIGLYLPLASWGQFVAGDRSAVARAMTTKQAVIDPCPPWLLALFGAGAAVEAAQRSAKVAGKLLKRSRLAGRLLGGDPAKTLERIANPLDALGIDPWDAILWAHQWSARIRPLMRSEKDS